MAWRITTLSPAGITLTLFHPLTLFAPFTPFTPCRLTTVTTQEKTQGGSSGIGGV